MQKKDLRIFSANPFFLSLSRFLFLYRREKKCIIMAAEGFRPFSRGRPLSQLRIGGSAAFKIFDNQKMTAAAQNKAGGA